MHIQTSSKKEQGDRVNHIKLLQSSMVLSILLLQGCGGGGNNKPNVAQPPAIPTPQTEPYFKFAWHLDATSKALESFGYTINPNADIHVGEAWNLTKGAGVIVAIIDDGFDPNHEDIAANVIDTYNADDNNKDVKYYGLDGAHGTTCCGFIAAPANNIGIVGVAPEAKLILIKQDSYDDAKLIRAFEYAKNHGAKVVSCSWGTGQVSQAIEQEMKSLYNAGITIVFASGNNGADLDKNGSHDESEVPWVIGVGASGENNDVTTYSDYGKNIDLIAPGGDTQLSVGVLGLDDMGFRGSDNQHNVVNDNYAFTDGTSFACPIVSATVALMYSVHPSLTPSQVRDILIHTTDKVGNTSYDNNGFDVTKRRAYGKLNATRAVAAASN